MTNPKIPSAAEALALAFDIVKGPCSVAEAERAKVLFEIARELRTSADMNAMQRRRETVDALSRGIEAQRARDKLPAAGIPTPAAYEPTQVVPQVAREAAEWRGVLADPVATQVVLSEPTQRLAVVWKLGDKADCRNCHTAIIFVARRMSDVVAPGEDDPRTVWVHKYTDQRACAVPMMATDVEGSAHNYTFAEPGR